MARLTLLTVVELANQKCQGHEGILFTPFMCPSNEWLTVVHRLTMDSDSRSGSLDCQAAGRYLFLADNKGNLGAPAHVRYRVTVTPPDSYMAHLAPMIPLVKPVKPKAVPSICRRNFEVKQTLTTPNVDWLNSI
ncbi:hypothetical protein Btru_047248 [Bulinus truncatus]|nr:hypothetical protein Btru_047248 [Bulinus truncatus]